MRVGMPLPHHSLKAWGSLDLIYIYISYNPLCLMLKGITVLWVRKLLLTLFIKDCRKISKAKELLVKTKKPMTKQSEGLFMWRTNTACL